MTLATALVLWLIEATLIAVLSARPAGARVATTLAFVALPWPAFADAPMAWRSAFAIGAFWCVVRSLDFVLEPPPASFARRFLHLFAIIDTRLVVRGGHAVPLRWWGLFAFTLAAFVAAIVVVRAADAHLGALHWALRWGGGIALVLAGFEALTVGVRIAAARLGWYAPRLSHYPLLAGSVAEFWSARWNRVVGKVLRDRVFSPLAHRGPALAIWATFFVSAAFHAYLAGVVLLAWLPALSAAAFFLLQPPLLAIERTLRLRRRPRILRHAWTLGAILLLSPLFIEPVLRMLGL
jgi:hypothetical protein